MKRPPWSLTNVIATTPRVGALAPQELLDRPAGARVVHHVDGAAQVGQQVALAHAAARPATASLEAPLNFVSDGIISAV